MEQNQPSFRLRLNLFDAVILFAALCAGAFLLWTALKPNNVQGDTSATATVEYTVCFRRWIADTSHAIEVGDELIDNVKNFNMGKVISYEVLPAQSLQLSHTLQKFVLATIDGYEDIYVTIKSPCVETNGAIVLDGGYELHVGEISYIRGKGYMASGPITAIVREGAR